MTDQLYVLNSAQWRLRKHVWYMPLSSLSIVLLIFRYSFVCTSPKFSEFSSMGSGRFSPEFPLWLTSVWWHHCLLDWLVNCEQDYNNTNPPSHLPHPAPPKKLWQSLYIVPTMQCAMQYSIHWCILIEHCTVHCNTTISNLRYMYLQYIHKHNIHSIWQFPIFLTILTVINGAIEESCIEE